MTEPATTTATDVEVERAPIRTLREWNPTTDTMIEIGSAVFDGLRAHQSLPAIIGLSITNESRSSIALCPGQSFSLTAARNVAVWAQALGTGLTLTMPRPGTPELSTSTELGGHPVRIRTFLYESRANELVDLLIERCPDLPAVPRAWTSITVTPQQVIAAFTGHPQLPELKP